MTSQVVGSDFTGGAQLPNYVNGRLLTARDLSTGQSTLQAHDNRLGRAAGHGVVGGLWVFATATTVTVAPGLGVAPSGDTVSLGAAVSLPLTFAAPAAAASSGTSFADCSTVQASTSATLGVGCYLLTALPTSQAGGQAPMASASDSSSSAGCQAQWLVEGVQFKAIALPLGPSLLDIPVSDANRRTMVAHWCLGTEQLNQLGADPFAFAPAYSGLDSLDPTDLTPADVPLAAFYWNGQAVDFVDNWSARRRVTGPDPITASWSAVDSDRRRADGEARWLQFQDQAAEIVASGAAGTTVAETVFPLLPPVGFLPVGAGPLADVVTRLSRVLTEAQDKAPDQQRVAPEMFSINRWAVLANLERGVSVAQLDTISAALTTRSTQAAFDLSTFFGESATCGGVIDWDLADFALRQSWTMAPGAVPVSTFGTLAFGDGDLATASLGHWAGGEEAYANADDNGNSNANVNAGDDPTGGSGFTRADAASTQPLTWYLVLQNLVAGGAATGGLNGTTLYVVFMKNTVWSRGTQVPFISGAQSSNVHVFTHH